MYPNIQNMVLVMILLLQKIFIAAEKGERHLYWETDLE